MAAISTAPAEFAESHGDMPRCSGRPRRDGLTLLLPASIIVSFLAASSAPTPLLSFARDLETLPSRQRHWAKGCHHVEAPCSPGLRDRWRPVSWQRS